MHVSNTYHIDHNYIESPLCLGDLQLIQIGTLHCKEDASIGRHLHRNWFELTILTKGSATVLTNDVPVRLREGDIYLSYPAEFHEIVAEDDSTLHFDFCSFHTLHAPFVEDLEEIMRRFPSAEERILHNDTIRALVRETVAQLQLPERMPYREEMLASLLLQIYILLVRHFKNISPCDPVYNATQSKQFCFSVMHYIDTHIYTMKNPGELAEVTNYNYSYLSHLFRTVTSQTLSEYFQNRRLETAAGLLRENDLLITQIAQLLQYSSVYAFSKAFRTRYGLSPRAYRESALSESRDA
jgi:AraC-like DNA-binding protein